MLVTIRLLGRDAPIHPSAAKDLPVRGSEDAMIVQDPDNVLQTVQGQGVVANVKEAALGRPVQWYTVGVLWLSETFIITNTGI